jgi:hypothetical protein
MSALGTGFSGAPRMLRGGLVRLDPFKPQTLIEVIAFQYNPDSLTRTIQPRAAGGENRDRLEAMRLTGAPHETIKFDAEIDATDQLERVGGADVAPQDERLIDAAATHGLLPTLATLERLVTPSPDELLAVDRLFDEGKLEVAPTPAPLCCLVWGAKRVVPVLVTGLTITEEAFDPHLHPIRVKVAFELRVLTSSDVRVQDRAGTLYLSYRQAMEQLAAMVTGTDIGPLGLEHVP